MLSTEGIKILIVDDLPENIISLSAVLRQKKFQVDSATSGAEALELAAASDYSLFLLDVQMPDMNGFELAKILKEKEATANTPIIFLTAENDQIDKTLEGYKSGGLDYIIKPINTELLFLKINNFVNLWLVQKQLKEANKKLKNLAHDSTISFENLFFYSPDEIFILDENGFIVNINRSGKLSMGVYSSDLLGKHFAKLPFNYSLSTTENPVELFETIMSNGIKGDIVELNITDSLGNSIYYEITGSIFHTAELERFLQLNIRNVSKKVEAKLKLADKEEKFSKLIETTNEMMCTLSTEGKIIWVNRAWNDNLGYKENELIGKSLDDFFDKACTLGVCSSLPEILKQSSHSVKFCMLHKNGEIIFAEGVIVPYNEDGIIKGVQIFLNNVTEKIEAENKLITGNRRLNEAQRVAKIGSWELDLITNVLSWSDEAWRIFNVDRSKFGATYEAFLDCIHPDDREMVDEAYTNSLKTKQPYKIIHRLKYKDGRVVFVEEQCETFYDTNGNPLKSVGTTQDITDKLFAEERLTESENRFNLAMQGANDGLWDWDLKKNEVYLSPRWKSMLGYNENEVENNTDVWVNLMHHDDREKTSAHLKDYLSGTSKNYEAEFRMQHKDGTYIHILSRAGAIRGADGTIQRLVGTHVDITERKRTENFQKLVNDGVNVKTGDSFFSEFTHFCCKKLGVKYAIVGYYLEGENAVETISFSVSGEEQENLKYDLIHTPCHTVLVTDTIANTSFYPENIRQLFPKDQHLEDFEAESYYGVPLLDENNAVLGILVLLDTKPMIDFDDKLKALSHLTPRVANELNRCLTEKKLIANETFTKGILDSLTSAIAVVDENGYILQVNNAWDEFGLKNGATDLMKTSVGANYIETCFNSFNNGDEIAGKVLKGIHNVLNKKEKQFQIEYPCHTPNHERWFMMTVTNYLDKSPKVVVRHMDITERRKTEQKMKLDSEIFSGISDAVIYSNLEFEVIEWNDKATEIYGWNKAEIQNKKYPDLLGFQFNEGLTLDKLVIALIKNEKAKTEVQAITKDKRAIYISVTTSILKNKQGEPVGIVSIHRDTTERVLNEKLLQLSELNYKELLEQSPFSVITIDMQGKIRSVNNKTEVLTGYPKNKFIGKYFTKSPFKTEALNIDTTNIFEKILKSGVEGITFEVKGITAEGKLLHCEINAKYIKEIEKVSLIIRDITEKKETERLLTEKNKELELFMYRASHDLKGPLSTSKGLLNLAIDECHNSNMAYYLNLLSKSNEKLENILSDLMEIVIIREGAIDKKETDLNALIQEIIDAKETEAQKEEETKLIFDIDIKQKFSTDTKLLKIALRNIYTNAIKYSKKGFTGSYIHTSAQIENDFLEINIADNGIGIDPNLLPKVFDMFFRATESSSGTGLGLYITKNAIDKLKGTIKIESKNKTGTSVTIKIPV